jgi:hypothetical protein
MEQLEISFDGNETTGETKAEPHWIEVYDLPYYTEPITFYDRRMEKKIHVRELRDFACNLLEKENEKLTVHDLKLAFIKMYPLTVNLGGDDHDVTVKKMHGKWILSCNCHSWIFNLSNERTCKHMNYVENLMRGVKKKWKLLLSIFLIVLKVMSVVVS